MIEGALLLLGGVKRLLGEAQLRAVLWRMLGLLLLLMLLLTGGVFWLADYLAALWLPQGDAWYWTLLSWLVWLLAALLAALTGIVSFTALGSAAVAPWLDLLAVRTERLEGREVAESSKGWAILALESLGNSVRPLLGLLGFGLLAVACFMVPVVGQLAATLIWGYAGIRFLNFELMDVPASRLDWAFAERRRAMRERPFFYLGFGGMAMAMMLVPLLNLLVIPAAVVALSRGALATR
jgi:CysZ protein